MKKTMWALLLMMISTISFAQSADDFPYSQELRGPGNRIGSVKAKRNITIPKGTKEVSLGESDGIACILDLTEASDSDRVLKYRKTLELTSINEEQTDEEFGIIVYNITNTEGVNSLYCELVDDERELKIDEIIEATESLTNLKVTK